MHPQAAFFTDVRDVRERIEGSVDRGSRCGIYIERYQTLRRQIVNANP